MLLLFLPRTVDQSKQFVRDHPLAPTAITNMDISTIKSSNECHKSFLLETNIQILGIRFLKNDRKNFESDVQNTMSFLLHDAVMSSSNNVQSESAADVNNTSLPSPAITSSTTVNLPNSLFRIPSTPSQSVEVIPDKKDMSKFEHLIRSSQFNLEKLFFDNGNLNLQSYLSTFLTQPITIPVNQLYLYRGQLSTTIERCLALTTNFFPQTTLNGDVSKPIINRYQLCLVLYAESPAKITDILDVFKKLLGISSKNSSPNFANIKAAEYKVVINAWVEIQEEVQEGKWNSCPLDKEGFKLRTNLDKKICIHIQQDLTQFHYPIIKVERCFGMLLSPGKIPKLT